MRLTWCCISWKKRACWTTGPLQETGPLPGPRILQELRQKCIDRETAQAALEELDQEEKDEAAAALAYRLAKRHMGENDSRKAMQKMLMAMARRGYGYEESRAAIQRALEQLEEEA